MSKLIGVEHNRLLDRLRAQLDLVASGQEGTARIVILRGQSGMGKSRIVRELYERLRDEEHTPKYWPSLETPANRGLSVLSTRKVLGPPSEAFEWGAHALPSFGWWVIDCAMKPDGGAMDAISQATPTYQVHMPALALAWSRKASVQDKVRSLGAKFEERVRELARTGAVDGAAELIGQALGVTVPLLGLGIEWGAKAAGAGISKIASAKQLGVDIHVGQRAVAAQASAAKDLVEAITAFAHRDLPGIVVIEDLHEMGAGMADFLDGIAHGHRSKPVLVVATAWPEKESLTHSDVINDYARWRRDADSAGLAEVWDVPVMEADERTALITPYASTLSGTDLRKLLQHYSNPLALQLFLQLPSTQERIEDNGGQLNLEEGELDAYPSEINRALYDQVWSALPEKVQESLMLAAGARSSDGQQLGSFISQIVAAAAGDAGIARQPKDDYAAVVEGALDAANFPFAWLVSEGSGLRFRERDLASTAVGKFDERYSSTNPRRGRLRVATIAELRLWIDTRRAGSYFVDPDAILITASEWLLDLESDGSTAGAVARIAAARHCASDRRDQRAAELLAPGAWSESLDPAHPETIGVIALSLIYRLRMASGPEFAAMSTQLRELLPELSNSLTPRHWITLLGRLMLMPNATDFTKYRMPSAEVIDELNALVADQEIALSPRNPELLRTRHTLAKFFELSGDYFAALTHRNEIYAALDGHGPGLYRIPSENAFSRASLLWRAERYEDAEQAYMEIISAEMNSKSDRIRALEALCRNKADIGDFEGARTVFERTLFEIETADGRVSMGGREGYAALLSKLDDHNEAANQHLVWWNHYDNLPKKAVSRSDRRLLVQALRKSGRLKEAVEQADKMLADHLALEDFDSQDFRTALSSLTGALALAGRSPEGALRFDLVLKLQRSKWNSGHAEVVKTEKARASYIAKNDVRLVD